MAKPKLRFPEFTDEWEEKQLKDFMFFKNGLNADKDKFGSGIKFISVMDILNNPFITYDVIRGKVNIDEKTLDNYSVSYGDVLFQRSSETREDAGKSNVYLDKEKIATFGGFVIRGKKIGDYSPEFMNSLLKSPKVRKEIISKAQGAQHINVGQETLENVSVVLPAVKEQQKIADFLSSVDDIIQVQEEEISTLEEQKKGTMQKLFNREVRFKADDGSEYPEWEEKKIGDIFDFVNGKAHEKSISENGKYIVVNSKFISSGGKVKKFSNNQICPLKKNDIVMVMSDVPNGKAMSKCFLIDSDDKYTLNQRICSLRTKMLAGYFIYQISRNKYFMKFDDGVSQTNLRKEEVLRCPLNVPCIEEQQKIADCLSAYDEAIQVKKDKLEVWKEIKKGLLQQMFV